MRFFKHVGTRSVTRQQVSHLFAAVVAAACFFGAPLRATAQFCATFETGSGVEFDTYVIELGSGFPADATFMFNNQSVDPGYQYTEIVEFPAMSGNGTLYYPDSSSSCNLQIELRLGFGLPEYVSFEAHIHAGPATVKVYNGSNVLIDEFEIEGDATWEIKDMGPIRYVRIEGGDNENWIDNLCIDAQ